MSKEKYFNFPIQLLSGFLTNSHTVLNNITDFAIYENSLKLELGTEEDKMKASANIFNLTLTNPKRSSENGKLLYNSISQKSPRTGLSRSMFFDFYQDLFEFVQNVALDVFLTMALMSIDLYALSSLLGPIVCIVLFQVLFVLVYGVFVCF